MATLFHIVLGFFLLLALGCQHQEAAQLAPSSGDQALHPTQVHYQGTGALAAHLASPGDELPMNVELVFEPSPQGGRLDLMMQIPESNAPLNTRYWIDSAQVIQQSGDRVVELRGQEAALKRQLVHSLKAGLQGTYQVRGSMAHDTLGDVQNSIVFGPMTIINGINAPQSVELVQHDTDVSWHASLWRVEATHIAAPRQPPTPTPTTPPRSSFNVEPLAPGLWSVLMEETNTRSVVVEFGTFLVVLETSLKVKAGERLAKTIQDKWPNKPIKYVAFSHHHPHYTGGLRAFIAQGATVVTTPKNTTLVHEIATRSFTQHPDLLAQNPTAVRVQTFQNTHVIEDDINRLEMVNIGSASQHTDEYVVFYLPKQRLLFEGDLGWFAPHQKPWTLSPRFEGLFTQGNLRQWTIDTVVQGWPIQPPMPWKTLVDRHTKTPPKSLRKKSP